MPDTGARTRARVSWTVPLLCSAAVTNENLSEGMRSSPSPPGPPRPHRGPDQQPTEASYRYPVTEAHVWRDRVGDGRFDVIRAAPVGGYPQELVALRIERGRDPPRQAPGG